MEIIGKNNEALLEEIYRTRVMEYPHAGTIHRVMSSIKPEVMKGL
jgi:hypothetical protein